MCLLCMCNTNSIQMLTHVWMEAFHETSNPGSDLHLFVLLQVDSCSLDNHSMTLGPWTYFCSVRIVFIFDEPYMLHGDNFSHRWMVTKHAKYQLGDITSPKFYYWNLTIIWVASRTLFGRYLLCRLRTYGHQTRQGGRGCTGQAVWRQFYYTIIYHQFVWMIVREEPHWQGASVWNKHKDVSLP